MSAIKTTKYQAVATYYANAVTAVQGTSDYYWHAAYEILTTDYFDPELDLLRPFMDAYNSTVLIYNSIPTGVVQAVATLQAHVLTQARTDPSVDPTGTARQYADINEWLEAAISGSPCGRQGDSHDEAIQVPQGFADISAQAGYIIDPANIL